VLPSAVASVRDESLLRPLVVLTVGAVVVGSADPGEDRLAAG
jgi:hypothetical protein